MRISDWSSDVCSSDLPEGANVSLDTGVFGTAVKKVVIQIHLFRYQRYRRDQVHRFELVTQENSRSTAGALGWGAAGAPTFGDLGLLAGVFGGSGKSLMTVAVEFDDGKSKRRLWSKGSRWKIGRAHV